MSHSNQYKAMISSTWREVIMPVWPCSTAIGWVDFKDHTRITCKRGQANKFLLTIIGELKITWWSWTARESLVSICRQYPGSGTFYKYCFLQCRCNHARFLPRSAIYRSLHKLKTQICTAGDVTNPWTIAFAWFSSCLQLPC